MSKTPEIKVMPTQTVLEIAAEVPQWQVPKLLRQSLATIAEAVAESDNEKAGPPYAQFIGMDWDTVLNEGVLRQFIGLFRRRQKLQIGIPVARNQSSQGDVTCYSLEPGRCVVMTHLGPHHLVINTYREIFEWSRQHDAALQPRALEIYVSDPGETKPADLETLVAIPLLG